MTEKEKAEDLIERIKNADYQDMSIDGVRSCAIICVDEIINVIRDIPAGVPLQFWYEVKKEIENYEK